MYEELLVKTEELDKLKVIVAVGILYILLIVAVIFVSGNGESISEKRVDEELL